MKILHVIDSGGIGGAEVMLLSLLAEHKVRGVDVEIASIGVRGEGEKPIEREAREMGIGVKKFRMRRGPNLLGALEMLRYAQDNGYDLVHSHGYKGNIFFGILVRPVCGLPVVCTLHGWSDKCYNLRRRLYDFVEDFSLRFIDVVVVSNQIMLTSQRLSRMPSLNLAVVNPGISFKGAGSSSGQFRVEECALLPFCRAGFVVGSVGRLVKHKGYQYLVESVRLLRDAGVDAKLVIIGEGDERARLTRLVSKFGLERDVYLPGYLADAKRYISLFDVFAVSSVKEGVPLTVLEAMEAQVPIVAADVGALANMLNSGKAGLLVEPRSEGSLRDAFLALYQDRGKGRRLAVNAYKRLLSKYSSRNMALGYQHIYWRLLGY